MSVDTIELKGLTFRVEVKPDDGSMGAPWDEHDGHGAVRMVRGFVLGEGPKNPGERVLHSDRGTAWLYDWQGAMALAKKDGWGLSPEEKAKFAARLGRAPTVGEVRTEAVQRDFDYCRRWLNGDWHWCGVVVTLLDVEGNATRETESLWGIESEGCDGSEVPDIVCAAQRKRAAEIALMLDLQRELLGSSIVRSEVPDTGALV